jgi:hypothetical protein
MMNKEQCRQRLDRYEQLLFTTEPERVARTPELLGWLDRVATNMFECPARNRGRDWDQIRQGLECMAIEVALSQRLGVPFSPRDDIDPSDAESFYYDVLFEGDKLETKVHKEKWFTYPKLALATFKKHAEKVDFLVTANLLVLPDEWRVGFRLVAQAYSFHMFLRDGNWRSERQWYNHVVAADYGVCRYNAIEYFAGETS